MYKTEKMHQITFCDFNQSCGMQLDMHNQWVVAAKKIPWDKLEERYAKMFPAKTGRPAKPLRMALGALIIQKRTGASDRKLTELIAENPYYQYFIGLDSFQRRCPFKFNSLCSFRQRIGLEFMREANELLLSNLGATLEHAEEERGSGNGTAIIDATCSPSYIKYPQDFELLDQAREMLEKIIDRLHALSGQEHKPRTYRRVMRREYLSVAKSKRRSTKNVRHLIRKELGCIRRNVGHIAQYLTEGLALLGNEKALLDTIGRLYVQQKHMFDSHTHRVGKRIVSLSQPFVRPVVRGKAKAPVEFGAKYDVSIDEKGHARIERISFDPYNEGTGLKAVIERYLERTGHYPGRVLVDQIYRTRENRTYCKERGIRMSGPKLGRPKKGTAHRMTAEERRDNVDRIEVERFFSLEKRANGAGIIMTRLENTTLASIALSVFVTNLFAAPMKSIFLLCFVDSGNCAEGVILIAMLDG